MLIIQQKGEKLMSHLTQADVQHVARLARMRLSPAEIERMQEQLSAILEYIELLQEVDVEGVPPSSHVTGLSSVMRPDEVQSMLSQAEALRNTADQQEGMFRVKAVFEE
jgi:aspartyl-tRNA(Asn)/glutamyl-tRNA(Gln) amidotransferase subunit C